MADTRPRDILGPSEAALASASETVRRWDIAFVSGSLTLVLVGGLCASALWAVGQPDLPRIQSLQVACHAINELALMGRRGWMAWAWLFAHPGIALRLLTCLLLAAASSSWVFWQESKSTSRVRHIEGDRLLEGKEALLAAKKQSDRAPWAFLHPDLGVSKEVFTYHGLIVGGTGAGKTQILWKLVKQIAVLKNRKAWLYDPKGDWTEALPNALLISPWDSRSARWDISADVRTPQAAEILAQSLIPSKEGDFWGLAARAIVVGVLIMLIYKRQHEGQPWGWRRLADALQGDPYELHDIMAEYYPAGLRLLADPSSTTALNVLQTISAHARVIDQLAVAWDDDGRKRTNFSITKWAKDGYKGPRQIILRGGSDRELTARYIAAMVNTLIPVVLSELPDNWQKRTLALFLDEFTSIGKIDIGPLLDKGRSKGCCVWLGFQTLDQVKELYGQNFANGMQSMVGTTIVSRIGMGETQTFMANLFGKRRVATTNYSHSPGSLAPSVSQHEETRPVVLPSQLGTLGSMKKPFGRFEIRAIVKSPAGSDPLLLVFQGEPMPKLRRHSVAAEWTKGVPKELKRTVVAPEDTSAARLNRGSPKPEQERVDDQSAGEAQNPTVDYVDPLDRLFGRKNEPRRDL